MKTYTVLDFETTGLDPKEERITQIGAIKITIEGNVFLPTSNVSSVTSFETLVNPEKQIPEIITELTGIDNEKVKNSPTESEAILKLVEFLGEDSIIVAQNAPFDLGFLHHATLRAGEVPNVYNFYCTRTMSAVFYPSISHRLVDMCTFFDINLTNAHDASNDAKATLELFSKLSSIANSHSVNFLNKLVHHPDRKMNFEPTNKIIIPLQKR
ncbi:DNA polymerase exonuclease subunit [Bacillus phage G]|uniref:Gp392 n=1 Tax=Bacillus phage G TaxID=2884420 RepID=G3MAD3_9CAUD|nr:DNA polymerase exonuclease subunit [Bacillus phage G]AEO93651.1 gp392 [Bacillus phage G]